MFSHIRLHAVKEPGGPPSRSRARGRTPTPGLRGVRKNKHSGFTNAPPSRAHWRTCAVARLGRRAMPVCTEDTCETEPASRLKVVTERCGCLLTSGPPGPPLPDHVWVLFALDEPRWLISLEKGIAKKRPRPGVQAPAGRQPVRLMMWVPFLCFVLSFFFYIPPLGSSSSIVVHVWRVLYLFIFMFNVWKMTSYYTRTKKLKVCVCISSLQRNIFSANLYIKYNVQVISLMILLGFYDEMCLSKLIYIKNIIMNIY